MQIVSITCFPALLTLLGTMELVGRGRREVNIVVLARGGHRRAANQLT